MAAKKRTKDPNDDVNFFDALTMLEKERNIPAEYLIEKIKAAIVIAVKKNYDVDDEHVRVLDGEKRAGDAVLTQPLLIEHDVRLHNSAARAARDARGVPDELRAVELSAARTVVAVARAVQLKDLLAARLLVQPVDVLRHDGAKLPRSFPLGQLFVRRVRLEVQREQLVAVKREKLLRVRLEKRM